MMISLKDHFKRSDDESPERAFTRFKKEVQTKISDKLGHTADMTLRAYISDTTREGLNEAFARSQPNATESDVDDKSRALAETILWLEVGPGNVVV